ncbi:hypothetical protein PQQ96_40545 [Paraburkholderia sediminicola]|uniref:hypothetical protein n=1 Tax=Paraburkholderia sediminicola TaxID=458836 RepID=UPI0038B81BFF
MNTPDGIKSPTPVPIIRTGDGRAPRIIDHIVLNGRLHDIFCTLVDEGFDGVSVSFCRETGLTWRIELSTPAGVFFEWLCHRSKLGFDLPDPAWAVAFLRNFLLTQEGAA